MLTIESLKVQSRTRAKYFVTVKDDCTCIVWAKPLVNKGQAAQAVRDFIVWAETQLSSRGYRVLRLRSDGGGEYTSNEQRAFLMQRGIELQRSAAYTSQQNGLAERLNLTLLNDVRAMLHGARLPHMLWSDVLLTAVHLRNRCVIRALAGQTPYEAWHGVKPDISNLRAFGCLAYAHLHLHQQPQGKLGVRAIPCALIGYAPEAKAWLLWDAARRVVLESRDVRFEERLSWFDTASRSAGSGGALPASAVDSSSSLDTRVAGGNESDGDEGHPEEPAPADGDNGDDPTDHLPLSQLLLGHHAAQPAAAGPLVESAAARSIRRQLMDHNAPGPRDRAPSALGSVLGQLEDGEANVVQDSQDVPSSLREALTGPDAKHWRPAVQGEYDSIQEARTYDIVELPHGRTAIGCKFVLAKKLLADGSVKYKARLVAKGFTQQAGIDYQETYSPVVRYASLRALLSLAAHHDWEAHHMDVKAAYLNGLLQEEIYMQQPEGFVAAGKEQLVCRLRKALYGLKQAGRAWHQTIDPALKRLGLTPLASDYCVYVHRSQQGHVLILALYVDDLFLFSPSLALLTHFKTQLRLQFRMEDLGEISLMLGMRVVRNRTARTLTISQGTYVEQLLVRFNAPLNVMSTPMEDGLTLCAAIATHQADAATVTRYQAVVGALMYAAACTRPDIAFAVHALGRYSSRPDDTHWRAVKHLLRYLRGTARYSITYTGVAGDSGRTPPVMSCYGDADYAGCVDDRKSVTGYVVTLSGGAINWSSRKQRTVTTSTTHAEFVAMTELAKDVVWWRGFLREIGLDMGEPTAVLCDNMAAVALAFNPTHHERTKHFAVLQQYIRELISSGEIHVEYIPTQRNAADVLTKALARIKHVACVTSLGMTLP